MNAVFWWSILVAALSAMTQRWVVFACALVVGYLAMVCMVGRVLYELRHEQDY